MAYSLIIVLIAPEQQSHDETDADGDQQRLSGIRADVAANLIGDRAKVDVVDLLFGAVVLAARKVRRRRIFFVDEILRLAETRTGVIAPTFACICATRSGCSAGVF